MAQRDKTDWDRNVEGLRRSARTKSERTRARVEEALRTMTKPATRPGQQRVPVNFNTVAQTAGVSTAWLYLSANKDIADRIKELRAQQQAEPKVAIPAHLRASDASKDSLLAVMRQKVKDLEAENADLRRQIGELRKQLEVAYGLVHAQL